MSLSHYQHSQKPSFICQTSTYGQWGALLSGGQVINHIWQFGNFIVLLVFRQTKLVFIVLYNFMRKLVRVYIVEYYHSQVIYPSAFYPPPLLSHVSINVTNILSFTNIKDNQRTRRF